MVSGRGSLQERSVVLGQVYGNHDSCGGLFLLRLSRILPVIA